MKHGTGEMISGFQSTHTVSTTEKVRIKSLVQQTRLNAAKVFGAGIVVGDNTTGTTAEGHIEELGDDYDEINPSVTTSVSEATSETDDGDTCEIGQVEMGVAKIYDRTIVELGDSLGGAPIGIVTDDFQFDRRAS